MSDEKEISINHIACSGCMGCVEMHPELFEWDEVNEKVVLKKEKVSADEIHEMLSLCPQDCIELED
ncbi:ferredoxin [Desulfobaculum bizertense]|uniref:Ferredoxin n=1 Tax=Desulfobaculum bizertense DSM 18034 TaxID=1121442 RepID=A0A1T4VWL4_9BACT|nr:ferredoxin [Desulfobaculum bizertense]UIJ36805.1 ferredoxin [Desulfobaculum bizertense]SKA69327.1 ferredoxin [Desulfobaculum bizertense DSM 18034]